jgi:hypothetical protein
MNSNPKQPNINPVINNNPNNNKLNNPVLKSMSGNNPLKDRPGKNRQNIPQVNKNQFPSSQPNLVTNPTFNKKNTCYCLATKHDYVTEGKYRSFEFSADFRYTKGANSGIKYFIDTEKENGAQATIGCEYQVLDDINHPDAKAGFEGNRKLAGLYDLIAPKNVSDNGFDKWNTAKIIVRGNKVQHWLNGRMTVEYVRGSEKWKELVAKSKFKDIKGFAEATEGRILLQDHGNIVSYRNIRIREIKE